MANNWLTRLQSCLEETAGPDTCIQLLGDCPQLAPGAAPRAKAAWTRDVMTRLDAGLDAETRTGVLVKCGRRCISADRVRRARKLAQQAQTLAELVSAWNSGHISGKLTLEGDTIYLVYPKCYCGQVSAGTAPMSASYCECSRGWVAELFERALDRPATVQLLTSVQRGGAECRFAVQVDGWPALR